MTVLYTDMDCGIKEPHRHTGEMIQGHRVEYFCPTLHSWVRQDKDMLGRACECETPHMMARVQDTVTEIIEILPGPSVEDWLKVQIKLAYDKRMEEEMNMLLYGSKEKP